MPEYISGRQRTLNVGIRSYSENTDTVKVIGNVLVSSGNIGVGITDPTQDIDVNRIRIRDTIYDYTNYGGAFGYYLVKDTGGLKWVAVPPIDSNAIFIAENNNILGVSSFTGLNIISDELIGVTSNSINPNFADITIIPRWAKSGDSGIYTTKNVGIGTTIPLADFQVGFGTTGVTIDGSVGVVSAVGYYGDYAFLKNLTVYNNSTVGISSVLNELNVIGLGSTFVSVYLASAGGITTTGGDLYIGGVLYADTIEIEDIDVENINVSGIASINNLVSTSATFTSLSSNSGNIDNLISTAATITSLSGTNLNYSGISTFSNIDVIDAEIDNLRTQNIFNSGIITTSNLDVQDGFDVYANNSVFHDNVIIQGNLTVNGTEVIINVDEKYIKDRQIILGFSTTNNVDDTTANGGGIAIASTEGTPLVSLYAVGVNTIPDTYKQLIWAKSNTYGVGTTDAFLFNYAVGIGSSLVPNGVRLAVGEVQVTDDTINVEFINSNIGTFVNIDSQRAEIDNIVGSAATITNINSTNIIGTAATVTNINSSNIVSTAATLSQFKSDNLVSIASSFITLNVLGISTFNNGPVLIGSGSSTGTPNQRLQITGDSYFSGNIGLGTTNPTRKLDVIGDVRLRGQILDRFNSPGTQGSVLTSDPLTSSWYWAEPPPFVIGILTASDDVTYYPTLRLIGNDGSNGIGSAGYLQVDNVINSGFAYKINPARPGIGTTNPQFNLDVYGDGRFTGSVNIFDNVTAFGATFTNLNVAFAEIDYTTGIGASYTGIVTALNFNGNLTGTATSAQGLVGVPNLNVGIVTAIEYYGVFKGTIDPIVTLEYANRAGVATYANTAGIATYASIAGVATYATSSGIATYANTAGVSTNVIGGIASVSQLSVNGISTFVNGPVLIGTSTSTGNVNQKLQVVGDAYVSGNVGVGTTLPQYKVDINGDTRIAGNLYVNDVITRGADTEQIVLTSSGFLTTTSLAPVTVDSFGISTYRSAKYVVQVTTNNSLGVGSTASIKNLTRGLNYFPGVYSNVSLSSSTGIGTNAVATITVLPQFTLGVTTSSAGIFTFTGSAVGMVTGQTLTFNQTLNILPLEQSKLTGIQLNSSGFGYTTFPTITVQAPIIAGNTVPGVGVGSTALAVVTSMNVQNFNITVGIATTSIPTVTFSGPSVGTTATGIVGVGVSEISVVNVGSGYSVSPNISIPKVTGFAASVGLGISSLTWQTTAGENYTSPTITIDGVNGIGTGAVIEADVDLNPPNGLINFRITNVGFGYTRPPIVTITDDTGVGAAVTITRMTVSNVVVNTIGSGSTTGISTSDITVSPIGGIGTGAVLAASLIVPTNVVITNVGAGYTLANIPVTATFSNPSIGATVGLGVGIITITSPGIGYTVLPTLTFSTPTLGIGSTATGSSNKLGYDQTALFNGPGLGGTTAVYYVQPLTASTFGISTVSGGSRITLGYQVTPSTTRASIGGTVNTVDITFGGSGYAVDNILTASNFDLPRVDTNVGTGFSFRVNSTVNAFQISDLLVLQTASGGNPNAFVIESNGISDALDLGEFSADISGNNARLRFTPVYANNEIKFFKTLFRI